MSPKNCLSFLLAFCFSGYRIIAQPVIKPIEWGKWRGKPEWPPRVDIGAPVPDEEVPIDAYDFLLFLSGLVLVYILWQRNSGKTWKETFIHFLF